MVTGLDKAYDTCARIARDHYENFPVASWLLPRRMRPHVAAVYAFARAADDFADEGDRTQEDRLELLDDWHRRLMECADNTGLKPCADRSTVGSGADTAACNVPVATGLQACASEIFLALSGTIRACQLPVSLFDDLLSAFRQDVTTTRYETWDDVLDYCRRSANPVGRLVLGIAGVEDEALATSSDAVCTALQLTNFWQDLARDWRKGRLYLPLEDCRREGADPADLDAGRLTPAGKEVLRGAGAKTAALFEQGRAVCDGVGGRLGFELRLTCLGGRRILSRLESDDYDMFHRRPALGAPDVPALLWQAIRWRAR
jgi:squalene synthase HpnC